LEADEVEEECGPIEYIRITDEAYPNMQKLQIIQTTKTNLDHILNPHLTEGVPLQNPVFYKFQQYKLISKYFFTLVDITQTINPFKMKCRLRYLKTQFVLCIKHFSSRL